METYEHLNYEEFDSPVIIRIRSEDVETILPTYSVGALLRNRYGLEEGESMDVALSVEDPVAEFAFDASKTANPQKIVEDIQEIVETTGDSFELPNGNEYDEFEIWIDTVKWIDSETNN